ncbi:MAG: response regulator [Cyanobacteria bacterium J055]|nr:MAG: response regulator [Cyanobacteria bacterium J055]
MLYHFNVSPILNPILTCSSHRFTGKLEIVGRAGEPWGLYYQFGRLIWVTGGVHAVRRWRRTFASYCPDLDLKRFKVRDSDRFTCWDYHVFQVLLGRQKISREQANAITNTAIEDVVFDLLQESTVSTLLSTHYSEESLPESGILLQPSLVVDRAQKRWQAWCDADLIDISPNRAPILRHPAKLREITSAATYKKMCSILTGRATLRDLAVLLKQDLLRLALSLKPYIRQGFVDLVEIPDLKKPKLQNQQPSASSQPSRDAAPLPQSQISVACIDDSPQTCQQMEQVLTAAGYTYIGISDPVQALPILIERQPDVIFLDLVMPIANGYEVCTQIRRVSGMKDTPVIMLTSRDGLVDRVRAQMVKATSFLSKPIDSQKVIALVQKFAPQPTATEPDRSELSTTLDVSEAVAGDSIEISYLGNEEVRPNSTPSPAVARNSV